MSGCGCGGTVVVSTRGQQGPPGESAVVVDITYSELAALQAASSLVPQTIYFITDRNIYIRALTSTGLETECTYKATNADYNNVTTNFIGVWTGTTQILYDTLVGSFQVGEIVTGGTSGATGEIILKVAVNNLGQRIAQVISSNGVAFIFGESITGATSLATAVTTNIRTTSVLGTIAINKIVSWNNLHYRNSTGASSIKHPKYDAVNWTALPITDPSYQIEYDKITYNFTSDIITGREDMRGNVVINRDSVPNSINKFQWGRNTCYENKIYTFGFENWNAATANNNIFCQDSSCYIGDTANLSFSVIVNRSTVAVIGPADAIANNISHSNFVVRDGTIRESILNTFANVTLYDSTTNGGNSKYTNVDTILIGTSQILGCTIDGGNALLTKNFSSEDHTNEVYIRDNYSTFSKTLSQDVSFTTLNLDTTLFYGIYDLTITGGAATLDTIANMPSFNVQINTSGGSFAFTFVNAGAGGILLKGGSNKTFYPANKDWIIFSTIISVVQELTSSISSVPVLNTLFVSKSGNDTTAVSGRFDRPYLTIVGAEAAASSGQTIVVYPGTYTDRNLGKDGVNYNFMDGAIVSSGASDLWEDSGGISYSVTGSGDFRTTTGSAITFTNGGTLTLFAKSISNTSGFLINTGGASKAYITTFKDITSATGYCSIMSGTSEQHLIAPLISSGGYIANSNVATTKLYISADLIQSSGGSIFDMAGFIEAKGRMVYTGVGTAIGYSAGPLACDQNFHGDLINSTSATAIAFGASNTGTINFYGRIIGTGNITIGASGLTVVFYNDITTNKTTSPSISISAGTLKIRGKVANLDTNAASYGITKSGGTLILDNATIVTGAGGAASVYSAAAQNIKIYGSLAANVALNVNITDIAGGIAQIDADIT